MKKLIFFSLFGLLFLAGCANKPKFVTLPPIVEPVIEQQESFEAKLPPYTGTYVTPEVIIGTGIMLAEFGSKVTNEISYTATEEDRQNEWKWSLVSGYLYTYTYEDLGLKITTSTLYPPYFFELSQEKILQRNNYMIYFAQGYEYIQMFKKNPSIPLKTILEQKHLGTGCIAYNRKDNGYDYTQDNWFQNHGWIGVDINNFFDITGPDGSLGSDIECRPDKEYPDSYGPIFFVQSIYHKDRYYKISMGDACTPGPCSIFGKIEFF